LGAERYPGGDATDFQDQIAFIESSRTPGDEKLDVQRDLANDFMKGLDLIPASDILEASRDLILYSGVRPIPRAWGIDRDRAIGKAIQLNPAGIQRLANRRQGGPRSYLHIDELGVLAGGHMQPWVEKQSPFGFTALKSMVEHAPILNAVIITFIRWINQFSSPFRSHDEHPLGFVVMPKDKKIGDKLTKDEEKIAKGITTFMLNCGDEEDPITRHWRLRRDNMTTFKAKLIRDTLTCDAAPIETELTRNGKTLAGIYNVPCETVRIAHEESYQGRDEIVAMQVVQDQIYTLFTPEDLIYPIRNPRSDITMSRYGYSECEMFIRIVTGFLYAMNYNMAGFDRNQIPRGVLTIFGNYDHDQVSSFKRMWNAMLTGPTQRWRLPVFMGKDSKETGATWTAIDDKFNEMHFAKWMSFLVSIICATWGCSPEDCNMDSFSSKTSSLSGDATKEHMEATKGKGKEALISWDESIYNEYIIPRLHPDYEMHYVGVYGEDQEHIWEMKKLVYTVNQGLKSIGEDEHDDPTIGEAPLNPALLAIYQNNLQMEQGVNEEDEYGLPQDIVNRLKEPGDRANQNGGQQKQDGQDGFQAQRPTGQAPQQPIAQHGQAGRDVAKAQRQFMVFADIKTDDEKYKGWSL